MQSSIEACQECEQACLRSIPIVVSLIDDNDLAEQLKLQLDCADVCGTAARFLLRESELHPLACSICAEIAHRCARACEALGPALKECAEACYRCVEACSAMSVSVPTEFGAGDLDYPASH